MTERFCAPPRSSFRDVPRAYARIRLSPEYGLTPWRVVRPGLGEREPCATRTDRARTKNGETRTRSAQWPGTSGSGTELRKRDDETGPVIRNADGGALTGPLLV